MTTPAATPSPSPPHASPPEPEAAADSSPAFEIHSTPFRGKTLLSTRSFAAGDLILTDTALFLAKAEQSPSANRRRVGSGVPDGEPGVGAIEAALRKCTEEERGTFWALANAFKGKREMGRWIEGGLLEGREEEEEMLRMMGIWMTNRGPLEGQRGMWPVIARINHSCTPNCRLQPTANNSVILRATLPIDQGTELTLPYTSPLHPNISRQLSLTHNYNFRCSCSVCALPKDQLAESDDNRIRCKQFDEVVERWRRGETSARAVIMEGIALLGLGGVFDQEGLGAMDVRHLYWKDLFIVAASHAAYDQAKAYAEQFLDSYIITYGPEDPDGFFAQWYGFFQDPRNAVKTWGSRLPESLDMGVAWEGTAPPPGVEAGEGGEGEQGKSKKKKKKKKKKKARQGVDEEEAPSDVEEDAGAPTTTSAPVPVGTDVPAEHASDAPRFPLASDVPLPPSPPPSPPARLIPVELPPPAEPNPEAPKSELKSIPQPESDQQVPPPSPSPPPSSPTTRISRLPKHASSPSPPAQHIASLPSSPPLPPPSPPHEVILDPFLSTLAAPPVSVDVSKDELAQLAAKRRAQGGREGQTVVDEEGEWEKWPEEEVVKWEKVAAKSKAVGERERVDPPVVAQVIADQPRSKSAQRKAVRKAKTVAAAAAAVQAPKYPPGLPRPPSKEPPSSYAELVKPIPELPPQPHQPSKYPTPTTTPTPTLSASLKAARLARPSFTSTSVPAPVDAKPSWTRKSPILSKPKELGPSPPPPPTSTSSANPEPSSRPLGVVLATSAFLRKPTPSSPTPDLGAIPRPSLALVEEHEEEVDAVCSLGLGLGAGPLGQLDEDEDEDEGEGALGEDARFEDAEEVEVVEEEGEDEAELESIEEKLKRMGGGVGLGLWSGMGAGGNEVGEEAFEDAEEDEGADVAEAIRPTELVRSSSFAPASRPRHDRKKSVRFEEDRQEGQGQQEQEMSSWTASSPSPEDISSTGAPPHDEAIVKVSIGHTYLPPSPPESPPQHRHPMPLASPMSLAAAPPSSTPITRLPPFLRSAPLANANVSSNDWQQKPATATFKAPVSTPAPRSVGKDVDQWLSSTEDWQKRASQRRTLISILNNGEGVEATPSVATEPPSAEPSPPRVDVEEGEPPDAPVAAGEGGEDEACDVLAAPVDGAPLRHADTTAPRIEVQVPSPPPTAEQRDSTQQSTSVNGHELYKVEQSAELLPETPKRIVLANLERIKSYPAELPLSHAWTLFHTDSTRLKPRSLDYQVVTSRIFTVSTVPALCGSLKALAGKVPPSSLRKVGIVGCLRNGTSLAFFREGAEPTWENEWNKEGGRVIISLSRRALLDPIFERLILLLAGSSLDHTIEYLPKTSLENDEQQGIIVGVVANRRSVPGGDRLEVWLAGAQKGRRPSKEWIERVKKALVSTLHLPELEDSLRYRKHGS